MTLNNTIDLIIPTLNEEQYIGSLLSQVDVETLNRIIVADASSKDQTKDIANGNGVYYINCKQRSRGAQMNEGASIASSEYLLFLHADVELPKDFFKKLLTIIETKDIEVANFRIRFDSKNRFLAANAWFSRFTLQAFQFGDQGLLIKRSVFRKLIGFDENLIYMEGNDIIRRARKEYQFQKLPLQLKVSDRKYKKFGVVKLQFCYYIIYLLTVIGISQKKVSGLFSKLFS